MNKSQLLDIIVIPTLKEIPHGYSESAALTVMMIIAHESLRGHYIAQSGGPALGLGNIEPATHDSVWLNGDSAPKNGFAMGFISQCQYSTLSYFKGLLNEGELDESDSKDLNISHAFHPAPSRMNYDMRYAVFMIRQRLFMKPEALPDNPADISIYLKKFWNSAGGAATDTSYLTDYEQWR